MTEYADLEIGLHRREGDSYAIEFRFSQPNSEAEVRLGQGQPVQATIDLNALTQLTSDSAAYGRTLTQSFFAEPAVQTAFAQARTSAQSLGSPMRLRLLIGPSASELHSLHWETLCDPQDGTPLSTGENLLFSRYLSSAAVNPCPCGYWGNPTHNCTCSPAIVTRYQKRISGPLLSHFDIPMDVPHVDYEKLASDWAGESSETIRQRVVVERKQQDVLVYTRLLAM